jgi:hypothetical protein
MQEQWQTAYKLPIPARGLTPRQSRFVELALSGLSNAEAYRRAYQKLAGRIKNRDAANGAYRVAKAPAVRTRIAEIQNRSKRAELLSVNERLSLLARIVRSPYSKPMDRIRAIVVYTRIAGDGGPDRKEVSVKNAPGEAVQGVIRGLTKREKVADMLADLKARDAAESPCRRTRPIRIKPMVKLTPEQSRESTFRDQRPTRPFSA